MMKQVIMGLSARQPSRHKAGGDSGRPKSASLHLPRSQHHSHFELHDDMDVVKPGPLSLVSVLVWVGGGPVFNVLYVVKPGPLSLVSVLVWVGGSPVFNVLYLVKPGPLSLVCVMVGVGVAQFLMSCVVKSGPLSLISSSMCTMLG